MTSHSPTPNDYEEEEEQDTDSSSTSSSSPSTYPQIQFPYFTSLPPELRHQIWRYAVPSAGINFFNVHCFPNDHAGCNRSTSPPWAYLDLRRLSIEDDDDAVSQYDPSTWQARLAVRQSCREARDICTIPASKRAVITLTRPRRGLFIRAGDGELRKTPLRIANNTANDKSSPPPPEPLVHRSIEVHVSEILVLSVENCSFSLPHEESPSFTPFPSASAAAAAAAADDDDDDADEGWAYDPQLTPKLPPGIPADRLCASLARCSTAPLRITTDALFSLLYSHIPGYLNLRPGELWPCRLLLMFDALTQAVGQRDIADLTPTPEVVWDRFGDCYVRLPWRTGDFNPPDGFPVMYRLTKVWPETNDVRERYVRSALLYSSKRPVRSIDSYVPRGQ